MTTKETVSRKDNRYFCFYSTVIGTNSTWSTIKTSVPTRNTLPFRYKTKLFTEFRKMFTVYS